MCTGNFEGPVSEIMAFIQLRKMTELHLNCIARCSQTGFDQKCKLSFEREEQKEVFHLKVLHFTIYFKPLTLEADALD